MPALRGGRPDEGGRLLDARGYDDPAGARRGCRTPLPGPRRAPSFAPRIHASDLVDATVQMRQVMAKAFALGPQVDEILLTRFCQQRNLFGDLDAVL